MTLPMTIIGAAVAQPDSTVSFIINTVPLVLVFVIFYMLMIRPQQRRMRAHQAEVAGVKKGDRVITGGGLMGRVKRVSDTEVDVELAPGMVVTAVKSTLTQVVDPAKPAND